MSDPQALKGLSCPRCGGMVSIPEGQDIVICSFCEQRSVVKGEHGIKRYQVPVRVNSDQAKEAFHHFLTSNLAIARNAGRLAQVNEVMLVHLPFWATWGRTIGWVYGQEQVGSGDNKRWEPREKRIVEEMVWNGAACDVGEFGVTTINLEGRPLEPMDADELHHSGMVFEPVGSSEEALKLSEGVFQERVVKKAGLDRVSQTFVRIVRPRQGVVLYPMWTIRYLYRGRAFQVLVDGFSGEVLYGKAPGSVYFRAAVLVGGMAAGAFTSVDLAYLAATTSNHSHNDNSGAFALGLLIGGFAIMYGSFRVFRYGEHYEYRRYKGEMLGTGMSSFMPSSLNQAFKIINSISE